MPGERTEQATQHRRERARRAGDLLHSRELSAAAGTLAGVIVLGAMAGRTLEAWRGTLAGFLSLGSPENWEPAQLEPTLAALRRMAISILMPAGMVMAAVAMASLSVGILQTGGIHVHPGSAGFRLDRISPLTNAKNLF